VAHDLRQEILASCTRTNMRFTGAGLRSCFFPTKTVLVEIDRQA